MRPVRTSDRAIVLHDGALGDVLLSLSLFRHLRGQHRWICLAARPDIGELFRRTGLADDARDIGSLLFLSLQEASPDQELGMFLGLFDRAYLFSSDRAARAAHSLRQIIPTIFIHTIPPDSVKSHVTAYRIRQMSEPLAAATGLPPLPEECLVRATNLLASQGIPKGTAFVCIHPGSGSRKKNWPLEKFFGLAENLLDTCRVPLVFLSSPADGDKDRLAINSFAGARKGSVLHCQDLRLIELAAVLSLAAVYIGNDSGATHLAAAAGSPVVALYGPTDPAIWAPNGSSVRIIQSRNARMDDIPESDVAAEALDILKQKSPSP
ncbi:MAG: hypothetical protein OHK006_06710 [Thermodesulfovibrionales bacterium]